MREKSRKVKIVNQNTLIGLLSADTGYTQKDIKIVMDSLENIIKKNLSMANKDEDVSIKLMPGITLKAEYQPDKVGSDPRTGEKIVVKEKLKLRVELLRSIKEKINGQFQVRCSLRKR